MCIRRRSDTLSSIRVRYQRDHRQAVSGRLCGRSATPAGAGGSTFFSSAHDQLSQSRGVSKGSRVAGKMEKVCGGDGLCAADRASASAKSYGSRIMLQTYYKDVRPS